MTEYSMTKYAYIVREKDNTKAFSSFEKALSYVSPLNYKAGMCIRFQMEDEKMYDQFMEECLGNMWVDHGGCNYRSLPRKQRVYTTWHHQGRIY